MRRGDPQKTCKPVDWGDEEIRRKVIIDQRRFLWHEDTLDKLAAWIGLRQGMSVLDVGCGHGYIGSAFRKHLGENGSYTGLDREYSLLREAYQLSEELARAGTEDFVRGDALGLPFPDGTFDWTVCQTLLMHAGDPEKILSEMIRVTRPGGIVTCFEPDNISAMRRRPYLSYSEPAIEDELLYMRVMHHWVQGRKKLGLGDYGIGCRIPSMMKEQKLTQIGIRANDLVWFFQPPFNTPFMEFSLEQMKRRVEEQEKQGEKGFRQTREFRHFFFEGGGTEHLWRKYNAMVRKNAESTFPKMKEQLDNGTLNTCAGCSHLFCVTGRKPL